MSENPRRDEVIRLFQRYLVEVVERYDLCPWARGARQKGEVAVEVLWGTPDLATWIATANELLARPTTSVAMVIAPELDLGRIPLHGIRNEVALAIPTAGVAEFHPDAEIDLATPSRLVPFVRRSPDPLLQLVPLAILDSVRPQQTAVERLEQARMLVGTGRVPKPEPSDRIAETNHATISAAALAVQATLADIAADRERSYAAVGITAPRMSR